MLAELDDKAYVIPFGTTAYITAIKDVLEQ